MNIEKTIDSFINLNNGCEYDDLTFTPQQIKKIFIHFKKFRSSIQVKLLL